RSRGGDAVDEYTRRVGTGGAQPPSIRIDADDLQQAERRLDQAVRHGLETAIENVRRVAQACMSEDRTVNFGHHDITIRTVPVESAAVYVPGGRAPYPSTVVMGVVTALVAGVEQVVVCAPPGRDGQVDPAVLAA